MIGYNQVLSDFVSYLRIQSESPLLNLCFVGRERRESDRCRESTFFVGNQSMEWLRDFIDEAHRQLDRAHCGDVNLCFEDFLKMETIPPNIPQVLARVRKLSFVHCRSLSSLENAVHRHDTLLEEIFCVDCPSLTSLSSLMSSPSPKSILRRLYFTKCGLQVTADDKLGIGSRSSPSEQTVIHRNRDARCIFYMKECHSLVCLPSSIKHHNLLCKMARNLRLN